MGRMWGGDNGAYSGMFEEESFFKFLDKMLPYQKTNLFIACPDKIFDAKETLLLYKKYHKKIKKMGYFVALVTQDGLDTKRDYVYYDDIKIHFRDIDWLFIGGSNEHKKDMRTAAIIKNAKRFGIKIHIGRVNGRKRLNYFAKMGIDTVDGTHVNFEPKKAILDIERWIKEIE